MTNNSCYNIVLWISLCFLQVIQQKHVGMVSINNMKEYILSRSTNFKSRNHSTLCFLFRRETQISRRPILVNFMIRDNWPESFIQFLDSYLFNLQKCLFTIFSGQSILKQQLKKRSWSGFHKHEVSIFISCWR